MLRLIAGLVTLLVLAGVVSTYHTVSGSEGSPTPIAEAPSDIVGTWLGNEDGRLYSFAQGGTAIARFEDGTVYLGSWEPDGRGGAMFLFLIAEDFGSSEGFSGWARFEDDPTQMLIGQSSYERLVPPTLESFLEHKATPIP